LRKNINSPLKKKQRSKRVKSHRAVQQGIKDVLAELVEKLKGKLDTNAATASTGQDRPPGGLCPNLDRLTVGVDLGDQ